MNIQSKQSKSAIMVNLMCSSGIMMLVCALPAGISVALCCLLQNHLGITTAIIGAIVMTALTGIIGGVLLWFGIQIKKKRQLASRVDLKLNH